MEKKYKYKPYSLRLREYEEEKKKLFLFTGRANHYWKGIVCLHRQSSRKKWEAF